MSAVVCVSADQNEDVKNISVKNEPESKPLNLCKQRPSNEDPEEEGDPVRVKETLKELIRSRRLAEGKDELTIDFDARESKLQELTQEELLRQKDRKEQNRKAAARCREKKKHIMQILQEEEEDLKEKKRHLEAECEKLVEERKNLLHYLRNHVGEDVEFDITQHRAEIPKPVSTNIIAQGSIGSSPVSDNQHNLKENGKSDSEQNFNGNNLSAATIDITEQNSSGISSARGSSADFRDQGRPKIVNKHPKQYYKERFQQDMSAEKSSEDNSRLGQTRFTGPDTTWSYKKHCLQQESLVVGDKPPSEVQVPNNHEWNCNSFLKESEPLDFSKKDINVSSIRTSVQLVESQNEDSHEAVDVRSSLLPLTVIESESEGSQIDSSQQSCATDVSDSSQETPYRNKYYRQQRANIPLEMKLGDSSEDSDSDEEAMLIDLSQSSAENDAD